MATVMKDAFKRALAAKGEKQSKMTPSVVEANVAPLNADLEEAFRFVTAVRATRGANAAPVARNGRDDPGSGGPRSTKANPKVQAKLASTGTCRQPRPAQIKQTIPANWRAPQPHSTDWRKDGPKSPPRYPHLQPRRILPEPAVDGVKLVLTSEAELNWHGGRPVTASLLRQPAESGRRAQLVGGNPTGTREVVMGFDFGTSSAKVVLGDRGLKQAFAVPFRDAPSVDAFLLPARLYEDEGCYSLHGGSRVLSDLKLSLMADPDDATLQERVVGYLALAIREARGWLFTAHAESYAKTQIVWTLALGQPADQATPGALTQLFQRLGLAAWEVAGNPSEVTSNLCAEALRTMADAAIADSELDVNVMPEIVAQIYGFVSSNQFDAKSRNIFLIADVGAGTVDSCLFRVVPVRGGSWSFEVYTAAVEPTGVMNLHRHRVAWWQEQLASHPRGAELIEQLGAIKLATEHQADIPDSYRSYLKGVTVECSGKMAGPDKEFFKVPLLRQVRGRTLYRAFSAGLLGQNDLGDVPFFLCGGGSRLGFYRDLRDSLRHKDGDGFTWLGAQSRELAIPNDLRAEGLMRSDYDRLSVAYGLSMLNLANVAAAAQIPRLTPEASDQWRCHYVDKDQC